MSEPISIKYNTRNQQKSANRTRFATSEKSRVQRVKVTPNSRLDDNYLSIPSSVKSMNSTQFHPITIQPINSVEENIHDNNELEIKPTIKKTCARCKESNRCVKLLCSKINRIEELVNDIAKTAENGVINVNNNTAIEQQTLPQIFITQPSQLLTPISSPIQNFPSLTNSANNSSTSLNDFSNYSLEDLQKIVLVITNNMISNKESCVSVVRPDVLHYV